MLKLTMLGISTTIANTANQGSVFTPCMPVVKNYIYPELSSHLDAYPVPDTYHST
jgi:hypothetical protein